jgi:hypothetical protein
MAGESGEGSQQVKQGGEPDFGGCRDKSKKKKRESHIYRIEDQEQSSEPGVPNYWIDLEILDTLVMDGKQYEGPDFGNDRQDTVVTLAPFNNDCGDETEIDMTPEDSVDPNVPPSGINTRKAGAPHKKLKMKTKRSMKFNTRQAKVRKHFKNTTKNTCRNKEKTEGCLRRIRFNNIDVDNLEADGSPPKNPKKYRDAVTKTKDFVDIYLNIKYADQFKTTRGKEQKKQDTKNKEVWGCHVQLPGTLKIDAKAVKDDPGIEVIVTNPYRAVINFGPDNLAVEFNG